jgi:uncharacterized protein
MEQVKRLGVETTLQSFFITGFNGLILGFAKSNNILGIGVYGEINDPQIPHYRVAKNILQLEKLTFLKFGELHELDIMAEAIDKKIYKTRTSDDSYFDNK